MDAGIGLTKDRPKTVNVDFWGNQSNGIRDETRQSVNHGTGTFESTPG